MTTTVTPGQSLLDIALQYLGSAEGAFELAAINGLSITDDLTAGQVLTLPETVTNRDIANYYATRGIQPATAIEVDGRTFDETFDITFY